MVYYKHTWCFYVMLILLDICACPLLAETVDDVFVAFVPFPLPPQAHKCNKITAGYVPTRYA